MQDRKPRLMDTGGTDDTLKPEALEHEDITILRAIDTRMPDGRVAAKWAVRRADGSHCICWSAGQEPTLKVAVWFTEYPNMPLPCRIFRSPNKYNTQVWHIEQRDADDAATGTEAPAESMDEQLAQIGLG